MRIDMNVRSDSWVGSHLRSLDQGLQWDCIQGVFEYGYWEKLPQAIFQIEVSRSLFLLLAKIAEAWHT